MHFSRLRLSGFKSFVDPTELVIEPGLTGVVGPNGCGKSNLLEAIRWVMGENRAKSLRGKGMEDVIFAGTDRRPARGLAEVTLVLDNLMRDGPAQYNDTDNIEVTRRIERDSGSAYRINGHDVRQKDVQLMFADAATGAHSPALVSQGRIGTLINAKPQDRRAILEEAAGISGLHSRRKEAEQRLRAAESNLSRLQDVMQAMEAQAAHLKRQARQAIRYRDISRDVEQVEAQIMYLRWSLAAEEVIVLERALRGATQSVGEAAAKVGDATKAQLEASAGLPALRDADAEAAARVQALTIELNALKADQERREALAVSLKGRLEQLTGDRERESEIEADAKAAVERLNAEDVRLKQADADAGDASVAAREALEAASRAATEAETRYDGLNEQALGAKARRSSLESDRMALIRRRDQLADDLERNQRELDALAGNDAAAAQLKAAEERAARLEEAREQAMQAVEAAEVLVRTARDGEREQAARRAEAAASVKTLNGEKTTLLRLIERDSTKATAPVLDEVTVAPGYETAFGAALGADVEVGRDKADERHWRALDNCAHGGWPEGVTGLSTYVSVPDVLARRLAYIGLIAENEDAAVLQAKLSPGQQLVNAAGHVWRWDGFVDTSGGNSAAADRLARKNRLQALAVSLEEAEALLVEVSDAESLARTATEAARADEKAKRLGREETDKQLAEARRTALRAQEEASRRASRVGSLKETIARLTREAEEADARVKGLEKSLSELPDTAALDAKLGETRSEVEQLRSALASARAAHDSLKREADSRRDRLRAIAAELAAWGERQTRAATKIIELVARYGETEQELAAVTSKPDEEAAKEEALVGRLMEAEEARANAARALSEAQAGLVVFDQAVKAAEAAAAQAREQEIRAEAALENGSDKRKDLARQIAERFATAPTELLEKVGLDADHSLPDASVLDAKLDKLKRERDRLGSVNLRADEELSEIEVQLEHLGGERTDLESAIARLRGAIGSLNREGRERLLAAFEVVNGHFSDLFTTLFGGGAAHLDLTESDDPLEAGLEIFASPPGKKLQSLSLLSGGEQALTATALIFAVFMTNPAPICVLDEVDAPLDDANVERFCALLDEMIKRTDTRFLIVTHNAVTMSRMNRLFGVTMAERGVSTLVSVDLERAEALTEGV